MKRAEYSLKAEDWHLCYHEQWGKNMVAGDLAFYALCYTVNLQLIDIDFSPTSPSLKETKQNKTKQKKIHNYTK